MKLLKNYSNVAIILLLLASLCVIALPQTGPGAAERTSGTSAEITSPDESSNAWDETAAEEENGEAAEESAPEDELGEYRVIVEKNIFGYMATAAMPPVIPEIIEPLPLLPEGAFDLENQRLKLESRLSVTGIMSIGEKDRRVILKDNDSGQGFYLGLGGEVLGARIVEINQESVTLESPDGLRTTIYIVAKKSSAMIPYGDDGELFNTGKTEPENMPAAQRARTGR